ncbi:MAG: DUF2806 domain-containing protein [Moraxellaceae bacterium]|nr:DUF2806 domain-containing protein [Moraxellaceae bacterium]
MSTDYALQQKLSDKLWQTLFGGGESALLTPWQIRQTGRSHAQVRAGELAAIETMLRELDDLHAGRRRFNRAGEIVDVPDDASFTRSIRLNPLIEQVGDDPLLALRVPSAAEALAKIRLEADILALRRSLNVRRIGLRADMLVESSAIDSLSERAVDADWLLRWQEAAARAVAEDFQSLWARVLLNEVRQPGTHSLRTLAFLATLSRSDLEALSLITRLDLGGFVCREAPGYFHADIHEPLLEHLRDIGLVSEDRKATLTLKSVSKEEFRVVLRCQAKALFIRGEGLHLTLAVYPFTRLGREVIGLFNGMADTAYLVAVGNALKQRGCQVDIGDWFGQKGGTGLFSEQMSL